MKNYTNEQIETALMNKGFQGNGCQRDYDFEIISTSWILRHDTGAICAHVEDGEINGQHPTTWWNEVMATEQQVDPHTLGADGIAMMYGIEQ